MNILSLSWQNLRTRPLETLMAVVLFTLGIGLIVLLLLINTQFEEKLQNNVKNLHLVVGAKGGKLQMILSSVYQIDAPTGNIPLKEAQFLLKNQMIETAIPLALGDSYKGFHIVGTDHKYPQHYEGKIASGKLFFREMEVCIGAEVARKTGLKIGDTFFGAHGLETEGLHRHEEHAYKVVGIFAISHTVLDQVLLTRVESVWKVHEKHTEEDTLAHEELDEKGHQHHEEEINHSEEENSPLIFRYEKEKHQDKELTSFLLKFKPPGTRATVDIPKIIDDNFKSLGYASPAIELMRLRSITGLGADALRALAWLILVVSGFSVFASLYNSMKTRKYETALIRTLGASPFKVFNIVLLEGVMIAFIGWAVGLFVGHASMAILSGYLSETYQYPFSAWLFLKEEGFLLIGALSIGCLAAILPAWQAYRTDISKTLE